VGSDTISIDGGAAVTSLTKILADAQPVDRGFDVDVPDAWLQGRTAYGGLSAALGLAAALRRWPDLPPLRSAQIAFVGPLAGGVSVRTDLLRRGRSAAFAQADLSSAAGLGLRATFVFMHPQESHVAWPPAGLPDFVSPDAAAPMDSPAGVAFAGNFEFRHAASKPLAPAPDILRWARLRDRGAIDPMVELLAVGDALPPAAMMLFQKFGPISSMNWQVNLLTDRPATRDGWWLLRSTADHACEGSSSQRMTVHDADGALVATAMQSVALFV
jgi:acyl-CoA thioesterase